MCRPASVRIVPLGSLLGASPQNGYSPIAAQERTGKWVLGLSALKDEYLDLSEAKPAPIDDPLVDKFFLETGDFLISRSNTLEKVGKVAVFRGGLEQCSYPDLMMRFRPEPSRVNWEYLEIVLKGEATNRYIRRHATGTSGSMKKISQSVVEGIPIPLPSLGRQKRIASIVADWNSAIKSSDDLIRARETHLRCMYQRTFGNEAAYRAGWKQISVSAVVKPRCEYLASADGFPLYSLTIEDGITPKTERYNREFLVRNAAKQYAVVHPGDIVFNPANLRWGAIARSTVGHPVLVSPIYEVLRIEDCKVNPSLLAHALCCPRQIERFASQTEGTLIERMAVKLDTFLMTTVWLPESRSEQDRIGSLLNMLSNIIAFQKQMSGSLRRQKQAVIQKLLLDSSGLRFPSAGEA